MAYRTINTEYGLRRLAQAQVTGEKINIVTMAVGDGNGNPAPPSEKQTQLIGEKYRHAPNRIYQDPENPQLFTAEIVVPVTAGGFTVREMGAFDDQGGLFAVCDVPPAYLPLGDGSDGSYGDSTLRMQFVVANADVVTVQIDPNVALATQQWALNSITVPFLLPGGSTGQVLHKKSNADGDIEWAAPDVANINVSVIEEVQTLVTNQTEVHLAKCTTQGLALYIDGERLRPDEWTANPDDYAKLTLAQSYSEGTKLDAVQNEPAAWIPTPLIQSRNLADVQDPAAARANLGVDSKTNTDMHAPPGMIAYFASASAPQGWLKANGAAVSRTVYASLFAQIGTIYGKGDGFTTFNLPDLRGQFVRAYDDGRGIDNGRTLGSAQGDAFGSHAHGVNDAGHSHGVVDPGHNHGLHDPGHGHRVNDPGHNHNVNLGTVQVSGSLPGGGYGPYNKQMKQTEWAGTGIWLDGSGTGIWLDANGTGIWLNSNNANVSIQASGANETRPKNIALLACIRY